MSEPSMSKIPEAQAQELRRLSHDLSNALEIIVQTNYLLGMGNLDENAEQWRNMLSSGVDQVAKLNRELREYVLANS
ncbi:MAG: hypothetical protein HIU87_09250 [Acidobacteria bacterium]|nr:hypothetical protein [Acidobacteriota bacterium]